MINTRTLALTAFLLLSAASLSWLTATKTEMRVPFSNINTRAWEDAQAQASEEDKLMFVDFDADYCATCRRMDKTTYMDATLADFIRQKVVALRVNVQDFDGVEWSQKYNVEVLPTMLVLNSKGEVVERLIGYQSAAVLLQKLQSYSAPPAPPKVKIVAPLASDAPLEPSRSTVAPPEPPKTDSLSHLPLQLFEISVQRAPRQGFTLQVGAFEHYEAALDQADMMRELYAQKTILCVDKNGEQTHYKLLVGAFATKEEAFAFLTQLRKNKMDGLVRDLSTMQ